jgi:hypothetical protein
MDPFRGGFPDLCQDGERARAAAGMPTRRPAWTAWLVCAMVVAGQAALAEDSPSAGPRIVDVAWGLGGQFKVGYWTPVRVDMDAGAGAFSGKLEIVAPDSDDLLVRFAHGSAGQLELASGQARTVWHYFKTGKTRAELRVRLIDRDGRVWDERVIRDVVAAPSHWQWVVSAGAGIGVEDASVYLARMRGERLISSVLADPAEFPDRWYGYEGVNALVVSTAEPSPLERLSDAQFAAFEQWLQLGGRCVISAGARAGELFQEGGRLHALRPGAFVELDEYWKTTGLEHFARAVERLTSSPAAPLAVFQDLRGKVICYEGVGGVQDRPFVVQYPFGLGDVTFVAVDLDRPPLASWPARPRLLAKLLQTRSEEEEAATGGEGLGPVTHIGYDDLAGQLRAALDQFPSVTLVRFSWIAGLLVLYIVLLGPADFFGLKKLRRPHWTWVTFPVTVIAFGALAVWLSRHWKGDQLEVNQLEIVDVDLERRIVRGTTWASLYSPRSVRLDVQLLPEPDLSLVPETVEVLTSWQGLPGSGLGGMNLAAAVNVLSPVYAVDGFSNSPDGGGTRIHGLPIATSSSKAVVSRWEARCEMLEESTLVTREGGLLRGRVVNPLAVELAQCYVYFENWAYPIEGRLRPGDSYALDGVSPLDLKWHLTRRRVIQSQDISTPWDRADLTDPGRVAEMLMFHSASGGRTYTRLGHGYQSFVDLSRHLRVGRAILVGRGASPASRLTCDGEHPPEEQVNQWTFYRVVIPVPFAASPS